MPLFLLLIFIFINGCNTLENNETVSSNSKASSCGGFKALSKKAAYDYQQDSLDYCISEKLRWKYEPATNVLSLIHTRNLQNCAADLKMAVVLQDGVYQIREYDYSKEQMDCLCYFDTFCEINNCDETTITVNLESNNYQIDLSQGTGFFDIDTVQGWPCLYN